MKLSYSKPFLNALNYASTSNIEELMKFHNLIDKTFETDFYFVGVRFAFQNLSRDWGGGGGGGSGATFVFYSVKLCILVLKYIFFILCFPYNLHVDQALEV